MKLNLGCGRTRLAGYIGLDQYAGGAADVRGYAETLPFRANVFDEVLASHVLEHVLYFERAIREIYRVLKVGGRLVVHVPYGRISLDNPYHRRLFNRRAVRQILAADNPDGVATLEISERWRLVSYRTRRRIVPWLLKPKVGFDPWPWVYSANLSFTLEKAGP